MEKELEETLVGKYPIIFKNYGGDIRETCMGWGMTCGDGWFTLLDDMCGDINDLIEKKDIEVIAEQVKEKFGGLRFYYGVNYKLSLFNKIHFKIRDLMFRHGHGIIYWKVINFRKKFFKTTVEKIEDVIRKAEGLSYKTCESCGNPGTRRTESYWIRTSCDNCDKIARKHKR